MTKKLSLVALAALCLMPGVVLAGDHEQDADHDAEMKAWVAANEMGEHHEHLARLVGHWTYTTSGPTGDSEGTMHAKPVFDGRYVMHTWNGPFMDQEFTGHGLDGYDNALGKYVSVWVDNFSTGIQVSYGKCLNEDCSELGTKSKMMGPDGNMMKQKSHTVWDGNDSFTMKMYMVPEEGDPVEQMTMVVTRHECDGECEHHAEHHADKHMEHEQKAAEMEEKAAAMEAEAEMMEAKAEVMEAKAEMMEAEMEAEAEAMDAAEEAMEEAGEAMEMAEEAMEDAAEVMEEAADAMDEGE